MLGITRLSLLNDFWRSIALLNVVALGIETVKAWYAGRDRDPSLVAHREQAAGLGGWVEGRGAFPGASEYRKHRIQQGEGEGNAGAAQELAAGDGTAGTDERGGGEGHFRGRARGRTHCDRRGCEFLRRAMGRQGRWRPVMKRMKIAATCAESLRRGGKSCFLGSLL